MHVVTRSQTVHTGPEGGAAGALRGKCDVMVDVLAPLHQQLGVDAVLPFGGAAQYLLTDVSWLSKTDLSVMM